MMGKQYCNLPYRKVLVKASLTPGVHCFPSMVRNFRKLPVLSMIRRRYSSQLEPVALVGIPK